MGLRGDLSQMRGLKQRLRAMPISVAHDVAQRAAPAMTGLAREAFDAGRSVYGDTRPQSKVDGRALTLNRTGATKGTLRFTAAGTIVRCVLGTRWAKYLIGKYGILPNGTLPAQWTKTLQDLTAATEIKP